MKRLAMIAIIVMAIFLVGCVPGYSQMQAKKAEKQLEVTEEEIDKKLAEMEKLGQDLESLEEMEEEARTITVSRDDSEGSMTFKKLPDYRRERGVTEKCELDMPFDCAEYLAKDGVIYLAIQNSDYQSKIDDVTLYLNDEECDPAGTMIEPGHLKDFECYVDYDVGTVAGDFVIEYYNPLFREHRSRTGELVVKME